MKEGYKLTELGEIPVDWDVKEFKDVMTGFFSGQTPSRAKPEYYKGHIRWITSGELNYNVITDTIEKITEDAVRKTNLKILSKGTFLIAITGLEAEGTRGSCGIVGEQATTNQSCMALFPKKSLNNDYLYHFYVQYGNWLAFKYCQGTKQQSYTAKIAKILPIIVPRTIDEQINIATALSDIDKFIQSLQKHLEKKRNIKLGTMQVLLTGKKRLKEYQYPWLQKKLGEVVKVVMGQSPLSQHYNSDGNGLPLIQGNADIDNKKSIQRIWTTQTTKICQKGDLILTVRAPVGSIALASQTSNLGRGVCSLIPKKGADKSFLFYLLSFKEQDWKILEQGSTFTSANSKQIKEFEIHIPKDIEEQFEIANVLRDMDNEIAALEKKLEKYSQIKQGMMHQLLTGKIRLTSKHG